MAVFFSVSKSVTKLFLAFITIIFIAACATTARTSSQNGSQNTPQAIYYSGRISLLIQSEPQQVFSGGFSLQGNAQIGEMTLTTPLGSVAALLRWQPGQAEMQTGGQTRQFASVDDMVQASTGAAIPVQALFAWLQGQNTSVPGWLPDTSRHSDGRISAVRSDPLPQAQLRIVLDL